MKYDKNLCWNGWLVAMCLILFSGCTSSDSVDLFPRRGEYEYEPPPVRQKAAPVAEAPQAETPKEVSEEKSEKKGGFFSFFSRKKEKKDKSEETTDEMAETNPASPDDGEVLADNMPEDEPKNAQQVSNIYRLKTGDQVFITLSGSGGLSEQIETLIDEEGGVKLRYIGAVQAAGRTPSEFEREIEAEYTERQKIYKEVVARVVVPNTFYFIGGEVRQPGRFPLTGRVTLSQAIPSAGNFTEWANERKIILARGDDRFEINFREIADDPTKDVELQPGDVITVERRSFL